MGFSRQEYWSGLPCPPPGDLPDLGIEPASLDVLCIDRWILSTSTTWGAQVVSPGVKISKCFPLMLHLVLWGEINFSYLSSQGCLSHSESSARFQLPEPAFSRKCLRSYIIKSQSPTALGALIHSLYRLPLPTCISSFIHWCSQKFPQKFLSLRSCFRVCFWENQN